MLNHLAQETKDEDTPPQQKPFFRPEAIESLGSQSLGAITLSQPLAARYVAAVAFMIFALVIAFVLVGSMTRKDRVTGITAPVEGSVTISSPLSGVLAKCLVREGQKVKAGEPLFEISTEKQAANGEISALVSQQLNFRQLTIDNERRTHISQAQEKKRALKARLQNLDIEENKVSAEINLAQKREMLGQQSLKKFETLLSGGFVSAAQAQQKQEELLDLSSRVSNLERIKVQLQANRIDLNNELQSVESETSNAISQLDRAAASLQQEMLENQSRKVTIVTAPQAGMITTITNRSGQSMSGGQVLATLIPSSGNQADRNDELEVQLYAPSKTAGFVSPGQTVLLKYTAFPYQKFGLYKGVVVDVSTTPLSSNELPVNLANTILSNAQKNTSSFNGNESLYRVRVRTLEQTIDAFGKKIPLRPGMTLEADILQENRKIWEWILEPVLAVSRR